jgi:hypothetical protein
MNMILTTEHFPLCRRMILTISFFFGRDSRLIVIFFIFKNSGMYTYIYKMTDVLNLTTSN